MFLVELEVGREQLYESTTALATAIQRGDVGPQARIFHRASGNWISITVHPEYKKAVAARADEPLPPLARSQWTFFGLEPRGREIEESSEDTAGAQPIVVVAERPRGWRGLLGRVFRSTSSSAAASTD